MKPVKLILSLALSCVICAGASAQSLTVKDFQLLKKDRTASAKATARKDENGRKYAVVKLSLVGREPACLTDAVMATPQPDICYVHAYQKTMKIVDPKTGAELEYTFPEKIKYGKTYSLTVISEPAPQEPKAEEPAPLVVPEQQFVLFSLEPANAVVQLGNETLVTRDGEAQKLVDVGTYEYVVSAKDFYPSVGTLNVSADKKTELSVSLRPADGWLIVSDSGNEDLSGADIYIDGEFQGKAPLKTGPFTGGVHKILVSKDTYENYSSDVTVINNDTVKISPCLAPDFAIVTLRTEDKNAQIWANGLFMGTGQWTGKLVSGYYAIESRALGHTSTSINVEIKPELEVVTIDVPSPSPVYGKIIVSSYPAKAKVFIDGKFVGETPMILPEILYGEYNVEVQKEGYKPFSHVVKMNEAMRVELVTELEKSVCCNEPEHEKCESTKPIQVIKIGGKKNKE